MPTFQTLISDRRKELKMTQRALAEKLNVSDKTVSKWETGTTYPDLLILKELAEALEVSPAYLLGAEDLSEDRKKVRQELDRDQLEKFLKDMWVSSGLVLGAGLAGIGAFVVISFAEDSRFFIFGILLGITSGVLLCCAMGLYFLGTFHFQTFCRGKYDPEDFLPVMIRPSLRFWDATGLALWILFLPMGGPVLTIFTSLLMVGVMIIKLVFAWKRGWIPKRDMGSILLGVAFLAFLAGGVIIWYSLTLVGSLLRDFSVLEGLAVIVSAVMTMRLEKI
jgi:transcriptional regulator with XRE-family HTH domain